MKKTLIMGKAWLLRDDSGSLIEDIDTDQIYHNAFLYIRDIAQMGQYAFGNLEGWKDFPKKAAPGDILIAGRNFGAGSSRQQAVDCFAALGLGMIIAPSYGAIYFRNAVNSGFPVLTCPGLAELVRDKVFETGDEIRVDLQTGEGENLTNKASFPIQPMSNVQYEIFQAGGLFNYGRTIRRP